MNEELAIDPIIDLSAEGKTDRFITNRLTRMELSELRRRAKLTQKEMAELTGLSTQCISDIESEKAGNPTLKSIMKYLEPLGYEICFKPKTV